MIVSAASLPSSSVAACIFGFCSGCQPGTSAWQAEKGYDGVCRKVDVKGGAGLASRRVALGEADLPRLSEGPLERPWLCLHCQGPNVPLTRPCIPVSASSPSHGHHPPLTTTGYSTLLHRFNHMQDCSFTFSYVNLTTQLLFHAVLLLFTSICETYSM